MNNGRHRFDDGCSPGRGKVWAWLVINRAALSRSPDQPIAAFKARDEAPGEGGRRPTGWREAGWREALGGWRRQNLTKRICDLFFHSVRGANAPDPQQHEGSAVPSPAWCELQPRQAETLATAPQALRLEDLLPESALRRIASPQAEWAYGHPSILAKAA
jgi:hypothetical protein